MKKQTDFINTPMAFEIRRAQADRRLKIERIAFWILWTAFVAAGSILIWRAL